MKSPASVPMTMPAIAPPDNPPLLPPPPPSPPPVMGAAVPVALPLGPTGGMKGTVGDGAPEDAVFDGCGEPDPEGPGGGVSMGELPDSTQWPGDLHACAALQQMFPQADSPREFSHLASSLFRDVGAESCLLPVEVTVA